MMGNSAGANLTMLAAYSIGDSQLPPSTDVPPVAIHSVINFYGPTDLARLHRNCKSPEYVHAAFKEYIGGTPDEFPDRYLVLSPLTHVSAKSPPTITFLGSSDRLVATDQAELLNQALTKAGVPHELYFLPGNDHGFDVNWGGFGTQIARAKIKDFLKRHQQ
jgi:acetyl esterase/lipase